jgi:hypothetical protein
MTTRRADGERMPAVFFESEDLGSGPYHRRGKVKIN